MFEAITTYFRNILATVFSVSGAMFVGLKTFLRPDVTTEYPRERWDVPDGSRMKLYNNIDDCIGCYKCSRICPTDCIEIETIKAPDGVDLGKASTGNPLNFWVTKFDIDMVKCCYCDLCTTVCPTECLVMTKAYEGGAYDRGNLIYHFSDIDSEQMEEINKILEEDEKDEEAEEEAASTDVDAGDSEATVKTVTRYEPEQSTDELSAKERIELRLLQRGKVEESEVSVSFQKVEEEVREEPDASTGQPATDTKEPAETDTEEPDETTEDTEEAAEADEEEPAEDDTESDSAGDSYVKDESKPVKERIRERLEMRGKL